MRRRWLRKASVTIFAVFYKEDAARIRRENEQFLAPCPDRPMGQSV